MDYDTRFLARFWVKVNKTPGCWLWTASRHSHGYGTIGYRGKVIYAHRVSWTLANGAIEPGKLIDHICHNPACVNPAHLRLVTNKQNQENRLGPCSRNKSGVRGVSWEEKYQKWGASARHHGRTHHFGRYLTIEEAEAAVISGRNELYTHNDIDRQAA